MTAEKFVLLGYPTNEADHVCNAQCTPDSHVVMPATRIELGDADSGILVGMFVFHPGQGIIKYASFRASNFNDLGSGVAQSVFPRLAAQAKAEVTKRARAAGAVANEPTLSETSPQVPDSASGSLVVASAAQLREMLKPR